MNIKITGKNVEVTTTLQSYIEGKIGMLEKFDSHILLADVEIDKNTHHQKGEVFHVRVNMDMGGDLIHAEEISPDMYAAVDICQRELERQLTDRREERKKPRGRWLARRENKSFLSRLKFWE